MLAAWTEILPLCVIRWLALRHCQRVPLDRGKSNQSAALARPDVLVIVPDARKDYKHG